MHRLSLLLCVLLTAPRAGISQQPLAPHDSVRGAIRALDVRARTVEVTTGVGYALRVVRLQVPAGVPISDRQQPQPQLIGLSALKLGDVIRARFGGAAAPFVAYSIERVGKMTTGIQPPATP